MKKILFVMTSLYNGGAERSLVNLLNELPEEEYEIDLLLFKKKGMFLTQVPEYVNVMETPKSIDRMYNSIFNAGLLMPWKLAGNGISRVMTHNSREKRGFRWKYFYSPTISKLEKHYDVALAYISGEILYYVDEKVKADKKIVWIHNDYRAAGHPKKYDYEHLTNMDAIVSISDTCVDILKEEFPQLKNKIFMLENITSSTVLRKRAMEFSPKEYVDREINILSIGRLHEQKGFDMAIQAAGIMKKRGINFCWFVLGNGELESKLKKQISDEGVEDCFVLLGARENPYPYIKNCTVFVQPSRYEGKSVVLDEAKILAVPIVTTAYPTVGDQLEDGQEGLIAPMTSEGLAEGVLKVLEDTALYNRISGYLKSREYGNQKEILKYLKLIG